MKKIIGILLLLCFLPITIAMDESWSVRTKTDIPQLGITDFKLNLWSSGDNGQGTLSYKQRFGNGDDYRVRFSLKQIGVLKLPHGNWYQYETEIIFRNLDTREVRRVDSHLNIFYDGGDTIKISEIYIPVRRLR